MYKMVQLRYRILQLILLCQLWQLGSACFGGTEYSSLGINSKESVSLGKWRWADDNFFPADDKQVHALGSFAMYCFLTKKKIKPVKAVIMVASIGITKECIDALVPWEIYGSLGGDGFSKHDLVYNMLGLLFAYDVNDKWRLQ